MDNIIELIAKERQSQIDNGRTPEYDLAHNYRTNNLLECQEFLNCQTIDDQKSIEENCPSGWNLEVWKKMCNKPFKDRLIMCAALTIAHIEMLEYINNNNIEGRV